MTCCVLQFVQHARPFVLHLLTHTTAQNVKPWVTLPLAASFFTEFGWKNVSRVLPKKPFRTAFAESGGYVSYLSCVLLSYFRFLFKYDVCALPLQSESSLSARCPGGGSMNCMGKLMSQRWCVREPTVFGTNLVCQI